MTACIRARVLEYTDREFFPGEGFNGDSAANGGEEFPEPMNSHLLLFWFSLINYDRDHRLLLAVITAYVFLDFLTPTRAFIALSSSDVGLFRESKRRR